MSIASSTVLPAGVWSVDPAYSTVGFAVKHLGVATVHGRFTDYAGILEMEDDLAGARASGIVRVTSVDTGDAPRDGHLRSDAFFDAAAFPDITFQSTGMEAVGDGRLRVTGHLSLHGVTNAITLDVEGAEVGEDPGHGACATLRVTGRLSRRDFRLRFHHAMGAGNKLVDDNVEIALELSVVKQA